MTHATYRILKDLNEEFAKQPVNAAALFAIMQVRLHAFTSKWDQRILKQFFELCNHCNVRSFPFRRTPNAAFRAENRDLSTQKINIISARISLHKSVQNCTLCLPLRTKKPWSWSV